MPRSNKAFDGIKRWPTDHPLWFIILTASIARAGAILVITLLPAGTFALDDGTYVRLAESMATGNLSDWGVYEHQLSDHTRTFLWPLKSLFQLAGAHNLLGQVYVAAWGVAAAALVTLIAARFLSRGAAIFAGLIVALLPSEVLWSSLILKDAAVWAVLALLALLALLANRANSKRLAVIGLALVASLFALAFLRQHTLVVACWSLPAALWFGLPALRTVRVLVGVVLAALVPLAVGLGIGGWRIATNPNFAERRVANAQGAQSAFVEPGAEGTPEDSTPGSGMSGDGVPEDGMPGEGAPEDTETSETGETEAEAGAVTRPAPPAEDDSVSANISHLPRGLAVMLFEPVPWRQPNSSNVSLARWEMLLWYPLLLLAVIGARFAQRYLVEMAFPLLVGLGMLFVYALAEGNIGTAYRHRGEFVWVVALLAALGAQQLRCRYQQNRTPPGSREGNPLDSAGNTETASGKEPVN